MDSRNLLLIIVLSLLMSYYTPVRLSLIREADSRSSTFRITNGYVLTEHVIHNQRTWGIMACAQLCLARPNCSSFNYEDTRNGMCELNSKEFSGNEVVEKNELSPKQGYSFSQLVNVSVSIV